MKSLYKIIDNIGIRRIYSLLTPEEHYFFLKSTNLKKKFEHNPNLKKY